MTSLCQSGRFTTAFAPENIGGAVAAWVADDIALSNGDPVGAWTDRKSGFVLSASGSARPLYRPSGVGGQPALEFDNSNDILRYAAADAVSTAFSGSVFTVYNSPVTMGARVSPLWATCDEGSGSWILWQNIRTQQVLAVDEIHSGSEDFVAASTVMSANTPYLAELQSSGTAWTQRLNGNVEGGSVLVGSNNGNWFGDVTGRDSFTLGMRSSGLGLQFAADLKVAAVIVVDGTISAGDRTALNAWVTAKYGIAVS